MVFFRRDQCGVIFTGEQEQLFDLFVAELVVISEGAFINNVCAHAAQTIKEFIWATNAGKGEQLARWRGVTGFQIGRNDKLPV